MKRNLRLHRILSLTTLLFYLLGGGYKTMAQKTLPYSYGFEYSSGTAAQALANEGWTLNNCYTSTGIKTNTAYTTYANTGNCAFAFIYSSDKDYQYLISPEIANNPGISIDFNYAGSSTSSTFKFNVGYSTTTSELSSFIWIGEESYKSQSYTSYHNDISTENIKYFAIKFDRNNAFSSMYIDDVNVTDLPSCPKPSLSSTIKATSTTATISWTPSSGSQTLFDIYYSTTSAAPTELTEPSVSNTSGTSYKITGLDPATPYYVWIRGNCGTVQDPDISGGWTAYVSFTTEHDISTPFKYGFEGITGSKVLPAYWIRPNSTSDSYPQVTYSSYNSHSGDYCLYFNGSTETTQQIGVLPELNSTLNGRHMKLYAKTSVNNQGIQIGYMSDNTDKDDFHAIGETHYLTTSYQLITVDFGSYTGDPRYIAIKAISNSGSIYIDDIIIYNDETVQTDNITMPTVLDNVVVPENVSISTNVTATRVIIGGTITITTGGKLTCNNIEADAKNLVIEDGGQLICNNSVAATGKQTIANANGSKAADEHWYTISTPVHKSTSSPITLTSSSETNITSIGTSRYDMFSYDEVNKKWLNQKKNTTVGQESEGFTVMEIGQGYLYRNNGTAISISGNTTVGNQTVALTKTGESVTAGLNLIGNPFPHDIYKGVGGAINDSKLSDNFYYLNNNGSWQVGTYETAITPGMGIIVQANTAGDITIADDVTPASAEHAAKASSGELQLILNGNNYQDIAYAVLNEGYGLSKLEHPNEAAPMLFINHNDKSYAVAHMNSNTHSFNLNLKAMTMGKYTLSAKAMGDFDYLHVIDRLTGEDIDMLLEGEYSFMASPTDNENRFIVKLEYSDGSEASDSTFAYQSGNDIVVTGEGELQIFDVMGRMMMSQRVNGVETINVPTDGMYIFRLNEKVQKIVVE